MLTPKFEVSQNELCLILKIHAPYTKVFDAEVIILQNELTFYAKPYLLRLQFAGEVQEEGSSCNYDADSGSYIMHVRKKEEGKMFQNLDLLTTLLCNNKKPCNSPKPLIEVINHKVELPDVQKSYSIKWTEDDDVAYSPSYGFGFANKQHEIPVMETLTELLSVRDPGRTSTRDRQSLRMEKEDAKFDSDYYLADLFEDEVVAEILSYQPWWNGDNDATFSEQEKETMQGFPNKEYLLDEAETKWMLLGLIDILFGYAYNVRVTEGEDNVESSWTIRTLSSTLSCCDTSLKIKDQLVACYRRILCYPQYRSWKLAVQLQSDVVRLLQRGQRSVLKCLLQVFHIFRTTDSAPCYLLNDLYISDYCVWIQKEPCCDATLTSMARAIESVNIWKADVGFELELIEEAAKLVLEEQIGEANSERLIQDFNSIRI